MKRVKKIMIDARFWGAKDTGLGRYTFNLVKGLAQIDHQNEYHLLLRTKEDLEKIKVRPANFQARLTPSHPYSLAGQLEVVKALWQLRPDLIHVPHGGLPLLVKGKLILTVHDLIKQRWADRASTTRNPLVHQVKYRFYQLNLARGISKAAVIIVPSQAVRTQLEKAYPLAKGKTTVVYEGIDEIFARDPGKDPGQILDQYQLRRPFVIYTGNVYPYKNIPTLIKAVKLGRAKIPGLTLAVACARSVFTNRLEHLIKENRSQEVVKFLGYVPDQDLVLLYRSALAFVSASLAEGFGITPLEALAAGCPAVVSKIPAFKEICGDAAFYFNPQDPGELAAILIDLESGKLKKRIGPLISKYRWQKMAKEIRDLYQLALGEA